MSGYLFVFQICWFGFICRYFLLSPMYGVMASYYGCFFRLVKIRIRTWLVLSLINRYDHLQRSLCFLVVGNVKTFDFESCSLFSFAFQLTKQERKAKPFL